MPIPAKVLDQFINGAFVRLQCQNPKCNQFFYVAAKVAERSKYCCANCRATAYRDRQLSLIANADNIEPGSVQDNAIDFNNTLNNTDMDLAEKLYDSQEKLHDAKLKLALIEKELTNYEKIQKELENTKELLKTAESSLQSERAVHDAKAQDDEKKIEFLTVAYCLAVNPGKPELPLSLFAQNFKGKHQWTKDNAVEYHVSDRWLVKKARGSEVCQIIVKK